MLTYIKMTRKENNNIVKSLNNVLQIHPFGDLFSKILEIQVISQSQISNCLISTSGIQLIDQILNEIKTTSLKILVKILTPLLTIEAFQKQTPNEFSKKFLKDYFSGIFQSLSSFCNSVHSPDQFNLLIQVYNIMFSDFLGRWSP